MTNEPKRSTLAVGGGKRCPEHFKSKERLSQRVSRASLPVLKNSCGIRERMSVKRLSMCFCEFKPKASHLDYLSMEKHKHTIHTEAEEDSESSSSSESEEEPTHGRMLDMIRRSPGSFSTKHVLTYMAEGDVALYLYTKEAILREELMGYLEEDVTEFYKSLKAVKSVDPASSPWPKTGVAEVVRVVRDIAKMKSDVICFNTEVFNWTMSLKLKNTVVRTSFESGREHNNRIEEFWTQYHDKDHRNNLPPLAPKKRSGPDSSMPAMNASRSSPSLCQSMCFAGAKQWDAIELIEAESKKQRLTEKTPQYHKIKRSMQWHVESGKFKWDIVNPPEGTRAYRIRGTHAEKQNKGTGIVGHDEIGELQRKANMMKSKSDSSLKAKTKKLELPPIDSERPRLSSEAKQEKLTDHGTNTYLEACARCWIVPTPLAFVTGHSWKLQAAGHDLTDSDLRAVAAMIKEVSRIEELDLTDHALLTEKALVPFLKHLFGYPAAGTLEKLILKGVRQIGIPSMDVIHNLLVDGDGLRNLRMLDLSHIHIMPKCHLKLAKAVNEHPYIDTINLAETAIGLNTWIAKQCVTLLLTTSVTSLDLSWNCFDIDVFQHLGSCVAGTGKVRSLSVSNCASACIDVRQMSPISYFLECLMHDTSLTFLDVSLNRMDFRGMLIIEDALGVHKHLHKLDISHNPLGVLGLRSVIRLLSKPTSGLLFFESEGSYDSSDAGAQTFNMVNPGGRYTLELARPYHRTILRMLYKTCERFNILPDTAFDELKWSKGAWTHSSKTAGAYGNVYEVQQEGSVTFVFNIETAIDNAFKGFDPDDFGGFVEEHRKLTKITPSFKKIIPMFGCWKNIEHREVAQRCFLDAIAKDFCLTPAHLEHMCRSCPTMRSEAIQKLLPCVIGGEAAEFICMTFLQNIFVFIPMSRHMRNFLDFNIDNPTGHYKLDLANSTDYAVAEKLLLLDRWEVVLTKRMSRMDISQHGNGSHIRNERYRGIALDVKDVSHWNLPDFEVFEFDYSSGKRCRADAMCLHQQSFDNMLVSLYDAECSCEGKLEVWRQISGWIFLTAHQMRSILGFFKEERHRAEVFVTLYFRVRDIWNAKVFVAVFTSNAELQNLRQRLGFAVTFPFIQPESAVFELNYNFYEQRLTATLLLQLAAKEGMKNIRNPTYIRPDGSVDQLPAGVPRSWETVASVPQGGVFKASYLCSPEERKWDVRSSLAQSYGYFDMRVNQTEVMWWTGLSEVSEDVLDWLEYCIGNFPNMDAAFKAIDGPDGNGVLTLREFDEALHEMKCTKFAGKDESARIAALFRYLDPGGEGTVSLEEWGVLDQLWKEFDLCIHEFVHFLQRTFGDDLKEAWEALDDDGSGELSLEEWMVAVDQLGYFGPAKCVFCLLDNSDDGNISVDEFQVLEPYKKRVFSRTNTASDRAQTASRETLNSREQSRTSTASARAKTPASREKLGSREKSA